MTLHLDELKLARAKLDRLRTAVATANQRSLETESQRIDAENQHAETLANILMEGGKTPSKPTALSALQSADDAAESALAILEQRLRHAEGDLHSAACRVAESEARAIVSCKFDDLNASYEKLVVVFHDLVEAAGLSLTRHLAAGVVGWGEWNERRYHLCAEALKELVPEYPDINGLLRNITGEYSANMPHLVYDQQDRLRAHVTKLNEQKEGI